MSTEKARPPTLLDQVMPDFEVYELHHTWLDAAPEEVYRALLGVAGREIRLLGPLMALRELPAWLMGRALRGDRRQPVLQSLEQAGFVRVAEEPGREIVFGVVGKFWKLTGNLPLREVDGRERFVAFDRPGYAKAAMSFLVRAEGRGSRLLTETRVAATDPDSARRFRRYWRLAGPGSAAIRRSWLAAVRRRLLHTSDRRL